jgi:hypothetical protein
MTPSTQIREFTIIDRDRRFYIVAIAENKLRLDRMIRKGDPLILFRPMNDDFFTPSGLFIVIAWWGSDIEEIEKALQLDRTHYPQLKVFR